MFNNITTWFNSHWTTIRSMLWRLLRGSVAAAISQTVLAACGATTFDPLQCYLHATQIWSTPAAAGRAIAVSLLAGFLLALSVGIRDLFGDQNESKGLINKLPV